MLATMKTRRPILLFILLFLSLYPAKSNGQVNPALISFDFYGDPIELKADHSFFIPFDEPLDEQSLQLFQAAIVSRNSGTLIQGLLDFKRKYELDDWLFYQLIRKTAQQISPKADNYFRYTLYKWFLLTRSGYDATLKTNGEKLLFYVQSDENIYNIPCYIKEGKKYVCLNYHDYGFNVVVV